MSLEDMIRSLATTTQTYPNETQASIQNLEQQMAQLTTTVSKLESQGRLPSQTEKNPRPGACAVTLRNGKSYEGLKKPDVEEEEEYKIIDKDEVSKEDQKAGKPIPTPI